MPTESPKDKDQTQKSETQSQTQSQGQKKGGKKGTKGTGRSSHGKRNRWSKTNNDSERGSTNASSRKWGSSTKRTDRRRYTGILSKKFDDKNFGFIEISLQTLLKYEKEFRLEYEKKQIEIPQKLEDALKAAKEEKADKKSSETDVTVKSSEANSPKANANSSSDSKVTSESANGTSPTAVSAKPSDTANGTSPTAVSAPSSSKGSNSSSSTVAFEIFAHRNQFKKDDWSLTKRYDEVSFYWKLDGENIKAFGIKMADRDLMVERQAGLEDDENNENSNKRTPYYPPFMENKKVVEGLKGSVDGFWKGTTLVEGILRVNPKKPSCAFVDIGEETKKRFKLEKDLMIMGAVSRNRACHGDRVVVRVKQWEKEGEGEEEEEEEAEAGSDDEEADSDSDEEEEEDGDDEEKDVDEDNHSFRMAEVVFISDYSGRTRTFVCTLQPNVFKKRNNDNDDDENKDPNTAQQRIPKDREARSKRYHISDDTAFIKAIPVDCKMPHMLVKLTDEVKKKAKLPGKLNIFEYWPLKIKDWKDTSVLPLGELGPESIGEAGDEKAEVQKALEETELISHDIDFPPNILDEVDEIVEDTTENFETKITPFRLDLRTNVRGENGIRIMTIDPATARDLDDAIHVRKLSKEEVREASIKGSNVTDDIVEFGVHIADVAHFVKPESAVDKLAKFRCTSIYLPSRVIPMLPHQLCNHLCSLNPNENKCAFSCFFRINSKTGELLLDEGNFPYIKKTVINTVCRFSYDQVQVIYDGGVNALKENPGDKPHEKNPYGLDKPDIYHGSDWGEICRDLFLVLRVCTKIRERRFGQGALAMHRTKLIFQKDKTTGGPVSYRHEDHSASHWVIEELMLLANRSVSIIQQKHNVFQQIAVLRNHPEPDPEKSKRVIETMKLCGIKYDNKSSKSLHHCLEDILKKYGEEIHATASMLTMKCGMRPATYFIGMTEKAWHFALSFPQYTHFTSPIRRYADVMVHRVLNAIIEGKTIERFELEDMDNDDRCAEPAEDGLKNIIGGSGSGGKKGRRGAGEDLVSDDDGDAFVGSGKKGGHKVNRQKELEKKVREIRLNDQYSEQNYVNDDDQYGHGEGRGMFGETIKKNSKGSKKKNDMKVEDVDGDKNGTAKAAANGSTNDENPDEENLNPDSSSDLDSESGEQLKSQALIALSNQCISCNKKKKASKDCQEELDRAMFCMMLRNQKNWHYCKATITEIGESKAAGGKKDKESGPLKPKNNKDNFGSNLGITVFAHEIGKEKKISMADIRTNHNIPDLFTEGVSDEVMLPEHFEYVSKSCAKVTWKNLRVEDTHLLYDEDRPDLEDIEGTIIDDVNLEDHLRGKEREIEEQFSLLSVVPVVLIPTKTVPIDFIMLFVSPFHPKWKEIMKTITDKERKGYNNAKPENVSGGNDDGYGNNDDDGNFNDDVDYDRRNKKKRERDEKKEIKAMGGGSNWNKGKGKQPAGGNNSMQNDTVTQGYYESQSAINIKDNDEDDDNEDLEEDGSPVVVDAEPTPSASSSNVTKPKKNRTAV